MEISNQWTYSTAGGGLDQYSWRSNPQYLLHADEGREVLLTLKLTSNEAETEGEPNNIGFAVFRKAEKDNLPVLDVMDSEGEFLIVHTTLPKKGQTEVSYQWSSSASEIPYRVIPYNGNKRKGGFVLSTTVGTLTPLVTNSVASTLSGQWNETTSGGSVKDKHFTKNEIFFFSLQSDGEVTIILSREAKLGFKGKIGFIIAPVEKAQFGKKVRILDEKNILYSSRFVTSRELVFTKTFNAGYYVIIPCTHEPGFLSLFLVSNLCS
eukprot:TRINITY_DN2528_c0_g1_i10.p1 TRINITY_DN2528_c0_g1~~TRINITY_DN2528_c0_g1_i10.p1  ORF type:complete len:265 (+),score=43.31 TRINITY_DN2528_c0_g1_i10:66-860(+)